MNCLVCSEDIGPEDVYLIIPSAFKWINGYRKSSVMAHLSVRTYGKNLRGFHMQCLEAVAPKEYIPDVP